MRKKYHKIMFLTKVTVKNYDALLKLPSTQLFSSDVIAYLDALSKEIKKDTRLKYFPDVAAFSFFCRRANILQLKKHFLRNNKHRIGRGTIFHIAPSNIPVNFAFSLIAGLLSGNTNVVRVPSKSFEQVNIIVDAINSLSKISAHDLVTNRIILVKYESSNNATKHFSLHCDVRVIWGGDQTINNIRKNAIDPRAFDVTFSDRFSISIINADRFVHELNQRKIALGFYNDTYLFDQNSCSAPHLIIWMGLAKNVKSSQNKFWDLLYQIIKKRYDFQPASAIDKVTNFYRQAIELDDIKHVETKDNLLWRVELKKLSKGIDRFKLNSGYFSEYHAKSINEISEIVNRKYQTLSYFGFSKDELGNLINTIELLGIDRIVPIGRTMDFSLNWDGYDLINTLSRKIEII
ncbi:MAG: acyl-CoA reductase [Flavobacteriaceae bacterium]|nr:acyl-CoA reductase [Flavobacteriaceae bacterium]|tara:strand:+ start:3167 stop:4381 length:1215 start_codon:yes stop_codon:yes gene_type:complete